MKCKENGKRMRARAAEEDARAPRVFLRAACQQVMTANAGPCVSARGKRAHRCGHAVAGCESKLSGDIAHLFGGDEGRSSRRDLAKLQFILTLAFVRSGEPTNKKDGRRKGK